MGVIVVSPLLFFSIRLSILINGIDRLGVKNGVGSIESMRHSVIGGTARHR